MASTTKSTISPRLYKFILLISIIGFSGLIILAQYNLYLITTLNSRCIIKGTEICDIKQITAAITSVGTMSILILLALFVKAVTSDNESTRSTTSHVSFRRIIFVPTLVILMIMFIGSLIFISLMLNRYTKLKRRKCLDDEMFNFIIQVSYILIGVFGVISAIIAITIFKQFGGEEISRQTGRQTGYHGFRQPNS